MNKYLDLDIQRFSVSGGGGPEEEIMPISSYTKSYTTSGSTVTKIVYTIKNSKGDSTEETQTYTATENSPCRRFQISGMYAGGNQTQLIIHNIDEIGTTRKTPHIDFIQDIGRNEYSNSSELSHEMRLYIDFNGTYDSSKLYTIDWEFEDYYNGNIITVSQAPLNPEGSSTINFFSYATAPQPGVVYKVRPKLYRSDGWADESNRQLISAVSSDTYILMCLDYLSPGINSLLSKVSKNKSEASVYNNITNADDILFESASGTVTAYDTSWTQQETFNVTFNSIEDLTRMHFTGLVSNRNYNLNGEFYFRRHSITYTLYTNNLEDNSENAFDIMINQILDSTNIYASFSTISTFGDCEILSYGEYIQPKTTSAIVFLNFIIAGSSTFSKIVYNVSNATTHDQVISDTTVTSPYFTMTGLTPGNKYFFNYEIYTSASTTDPVYRGGSQFTTNATSSDDVTYTCEITKLTHYSQRIKFTFNKPIPVEYNKYQITNGWIIDGTNIVYRDFTVGVYPEINDNVYNIEMFTYSIDGAYDNSVIISYDMSDGEINLPYEVSYYKEHHIFTYDNHAGDLPRYFLTREYITDSNNNITASRLKVHLIDGIFSDPKTYPVDWSIPIGFTRIDDYSAYRDYKSNGSISFEIVPNVCESLIPMVVETYIDKIGDNMSDYARHPLNIPTVVHTGNHKGVYPKILRQANGTGKDNVFTERGYNIKFQGIDDCSLRVTDSEWNILPNYQTIKNVNVFQGNMEIDHRVNHTLTDFNNYLTVKSRVNGICPLYIKAKINGTYVKQKYYIVFNHLDSVQIPRDYVRVESIQFDGNSYINTGYKPTVNTRMVVDFKSTSTGKWILGSRSSMGAHDSFAIYINNSTQYLVHVGGNTENTGGTITVSSTSTRGVFDISGTVIKYNDSTLKTYSNVLVNSSYPIYVGGMNQSGGVDNRLFTGDIYSVKIYEGTTLVRNLVPCYRDSDDAVGMYDSVNGVFYTNNGTGTLSWGYSQLPYIGIGMLWTEYDKSTNTARLYSALSNNITSMFPHTSSYQESYPNNKYYKYNYLMDYQIYDEITQSTHSVTFEADTKTGYYEVSNPSASKNFSVYNLMVTKSNDGDSVGESLQGEQLTVPMSLMTDYYISSSSGIKIITPNGPISADVKLITTSGTKSIDVKVIT